MSTKIQLTVTGIVTLSDADALALRLDTRTGRQRVEYIVESHLASGPFLGNRPSELKVSVQEVLDVTPRTTNVDLMEIAA